jgi:hypothetical protein
MTTPSDVLRQTIVGSLKAMHPQPARVQEIYREIERVVTFDADDLTPPTLRGEPTAEPSWKRNVRNVLQQGKRAGTLVNISHEAWRLPTPNAESKLDEERAWVEVRNAAEKALNHGVIYRSTKQEHRYRLIEVGASRLVVERLDSRAPETLTVGEVGLAARYLNAAGGRVGRRTLSHTVAKEVTLVFLHPRLAWAEDSDWIQVVGTAPVLELQRPSYEAFGEAPDDDPAALTRFARRVRRGQPKFRKNLLRLYEARCAVSGWGPESVLEAAHILLHANSGLNRSDNGILLRSDLHSLFDDGLLRIDPSTLSIVLHPSLEHTPYWPLNGTTLRPRVDATQPSREYLRERWQNTTANRP